MFRVANVCTFVLYCMLIENLEARSVRNVNILKPSLERVNIRRPSAERELKMMPAAIQAYDPFRAMLAKRLGVNANALNFKEANDLFAGLERSGQLDNIGQDAQKISGITVVLGDMLCARCKQIGDNDCIRQHCLTSG